MSQSFALYRLPGASEPNLVEGSIEQIPALTYLNHQKGFLLAPFHTKGPQPIILIHPDSTLQGWDEIRRHLLTNSDLHVHTLVKDYQANIDKEEELRLKYNQVFDRFIAELRSGRFEKLVLSRSAELDVNPQLYDFEFRAFEKACKIYPNMMVTYVHTPATGSWIGSTPEIIISGHGHEWRTVALAGTMLKQEGQEPEWSEKNKREQAFVSEYIETVLSQFTDEINLKGPYTSPAGHLVHLKTDISFVLDDLSKLGDVLEALHPTPAVCGLPKKEAFDFILANEGYDRTYYSGIIGWFDPEGQTDLFVNLRCMNYDKSKLRLFAGGGILPSSDVDSEWRETQYKMNTMKSIIEL